MEQALYLMFRVNMENLVKNKLHICREWHIQPSEIDRLQYFEYEQMIDEIKSYNKEQEKQQQAQNKEYEQMRKSANQQQNLSNYKMPQLPKFGGTSSSPSMPTLPKVSLPKFG